VLASVSAGCEKEEAIDVNSPKSISLSQSFEKEARQLTESGRKRAKIPLLGRTISEINTLASSESSDVGTNVEIESRIRIYIKALSLSFGENDPHSQPYEAMLKELRGQNTLEFDLAEHLRALYLFVCISLIRNVISCLIS
jgi:hypothetical protein